MNLHYTITFYSPWHCGAGLSAGADVDVLVVKDAEGLPYVPGKTLKGLLREAVEDYTALSEPDAESVVSYVFCRPQDGNAYQTPTFFSDAKLLERESKAIIAAQAQQFLYQGVSRTAINERGVAEEHSLRRIETVVPCTLEATLYNVPEEAVELLCKGMGMVKHIGLGRSRGLGRCELAPIEKGGNE